MYKHHQICFTCSQQDPRSYLHRNIEQSKRRNPHTFPITFQRHNFDPMHADCESDDSRPRLMTTILLSLVACAAPSRDASAPRTCTAMLVDQHAVSVSRSRLLSSSKATTMKSRSIANMLTGDRESSREECVCIAGIQIGCRGIICICLIPSRMLLVLLLGRLGPLGRADGARSCLAAMSAIVGSRMDFVR